MLTWRRLSFVVVGALAARLHGAPTGVRTVEICLDPDRRNRERLGRALKDLHGANLPVPRGIATYLTSSGRIRCLAVPAPVWSYAELHRAAVEMDLGLAQPVAVACLEDLLRIRLAPRWRRDRLEAALVAAVAEEQERNRPPKGPVP